MSSSFLLILYIYIYALLNDLAGFAWLVQVRAAGELEGAILMYTSSKYSFHFTEENLGETASVSGRVTETVHKVR